MSTIHDTVSHALRETGLGDYISRAAPVIEALQRREAENSTQLLAWAEEFNLDSETVRDRLADLGLELEPEEDEDSEEDEGPEEDEDPEEQVGDGDLSDRLDRLISRVNELTEFARRNGFNG
jgi:hypothetical protein